MNGGHCHTITLLVRQKEPNQIGSAPIEVVECFHSLLSMLSIVVSHFYSIYSHVYNVESDVGVKSLYNSVIEEQSGERASCSRITLGLTVDIRESNRGPLSAGGKTPRAPELPTNLFINYNQQNSDGMSTGRNFDLFCSPTAIDPPPPLTQRRPACSPAAC